MDVIDRDQGNSSFPRSSEISVLLWPVTVGSLQLDPSLVLYSVVVFSPTKGLFGGVLASLETALALALLPKLVLR
jgi:hypothetical protein